MGSAEDQPRRSRLRLPAALLPGEPANPGIAVLRAVRGAAFQARRVVGPPNGIGGPRRVVHSDHLSVGISTFEIAPKGSNRYVRQLPPNGIVRPRRAIH